MARLPHPWRTLTGTVRDQQREQRDAMRRSPFFQSGTSVPSPGQTQVTSITIPDTGTLTIDGGTVRMLDQSGGTIELFALGLQQYGDRGITIRRLDGSIALEIRDVFNTGQQKMVLRDTAGKIIGGDSVLGGSGFDAPNMNLRFIPVDYTSAALAQAVTSGTFVATHECRTFRQNPAMAPQIMVKCSDGTTSGQIQFYDATGASYLGGFLGSPAVHTITVPTGTTAWTLFTLPSALSLPGLMGDAMYLQIHGKRTAGTGTVSVAPVRTVGSGF